MASRSQEAFNPSGIHLPVRGLGIDEDRPRTGIANRIGRRYEAQRRHQDLVVWLHARYEERDVKCRRARRGRHSMRAADCPGEFAFEAIDEWPDG